MTKRIAALLLCAVLLPAFFAVPAAAEEKPYFISVNDTLPPELIGCVTTYGGVTYVPYYLFTGYGLGISSSYISGASALCLYSGDKQLYFELPGGATYDGDNYKYSVSAIMRSGTAYVPLGFTARFFGGIGYSVLTAGEYGTVLRVTNGSEVLTDAEFLVAAKSVMRKYALAYQSAAEEPKPTPEQPEDIHAGERITLGFVGLPADGILERLAQSRVTACFFLTEEEVRAAPDTVRRLVCGGHTVGVYCVSDLAAEYPVTAELLFAAARVCPELVTADLSYAAACREQAQMAGLAYCGFDIDAVGGNIYTVTAQLETGTDGASLLLDGSADGVTALGVLLRYLQAGKYSVGAPRETDN